MNLDLKGKVAFVSGSSRGIGKAIARSLLNEGCRVMLNGRDRDTLSATMAELGEGAASFCGDVSDPKTADAAVAATLKQWGKLDILICNVGSGSTQGWEETFRVNLKSATSLVESATGTLADSRGNILCVSSIAGMAAIGAPVAYSAAKAALNAYVQSTARTLGTRQIRINAIAPGNILFSGSVWERKLKENEVGVQEMLKREVALNRLGNAEEIADFSAFLVSPRASFATGGLFVVDGGQLRS